MYDVVKYLLEGCAVAVAAYYIPQKKTDLKIIAIIAVTAAATFAVLDTFSPSVATGARQGAGFGIGYNITHGLPIEGYSDPNETDPDELEMADHDDGTDDDMDDMGHEDVTNDDTHASDTEDDDFEGEAEEEEAEDIAEPFEQSGGYALFKA